MDLATGDRLPFCVGVGPDRRFHSSDAQAGRPAVLLLGGSIAPPTFDALLLALAARRSEIAAAGADLLLLLGFHALGFLHRGGETRGIAALLCPDAFFASCGGPLPMPVVVVIDRASRIMGCWSAGPADGITLADRAVETLAGLARECAQHCVVSAPVLAIPGLLDTALCRSLVERFESSASFDSGMSGARDCVDHGRKCRRDWLLEPGDGFHDNVLGLLLRRCGPDILRAYRHHITHVDRILVARYDEGIGLFKRHRDNAGESVAFRQFALSVNLNAGEYDGGSLLFPEFNDHPYRPATGEGIVFSASLLHEATRVTRGRRYVLLTFLHDAAGEARRLDDAARAKARTG